jgi:hypothetical protein
MNIPSVSFLRTLGRLRHWCPLSKPVAVYRVRQCEHWGLLGWQHGRLIITIRVDDPSQEIESLIHEWAHALTYDEERPAQTIDTGIEIVYYTGPMPWVRHGDEWGIAYARCYRASQVSVESELKPEHPALGHRV